MHGYSTPNKSDLVPPSLSGLGGFRWVGGGDGHAGAIPAPAASARLPARVGHALPVAFIAAMTMAGLAGSVMLAGLAWQADPGRAQLLSFVTPKNAAANTIDTASALLGVLPPSPGPAAIPDAAISATAPAAPPSDAPSIPHVGDLYIGAEAWARDIVISTPPPVLPLSEIRPRLAQAGTDRGAAYTVQGKENCIANILEVRVKECRAGRETGSNASLPHVVLVGDSHAVHWLSALSAVADARGWRLTGLTKNSCLPTTAMTAYVTASFPTGRPYSECRAWTDSVVAWVLAERPDLVILSASSRHRVPDKSSEDSADDLVAGMVGWVDQVIHAGTRVAAINHTPFTKINVPLCLARAAAAEAGRTTAGAPTNATRACTSLAANALPGDGVLSRLARQRQQVHLLDFGDAFCAADGSCPPVIGNVVVYRDAHHLTATYARTLAPALGRRLEVAFPSLFGGAPPKAAPLQGGAAPP